MTKLLIAMILATSLFGSVPTGQKDFKTIKNTTLGQLTFFSGIGQIYVPKNDLAQSYYNEIKKRAFNCVNKSKSVKDINVCEKTVKSFGHSMVKKYNSQVPAKDRVNVKEIRQQILRSFRLP